MPPRSSWARHAAAAALAIASAVPALGQTDLDAFMKDVLSKRDENWKRLQQYVLDERGQFDVTGPGGVSFWSDRREFTWYIRDGFFVRSPTRVNGVVVGEGDRRKYEDEYLQREQRRDARRRASDGSPAPAPSDVDGLIRQTREPEFISSAYFLRFRFEEGKYALVGREALNGRDVLRIEYYPSTLFRGTDRRRDRGHKDDDASYDEAFRRLMNKTALVTIWVDQADHQIVKYTFDNVALDFLPAQWLLQMDELHATMTMGQPFKAGAEPADAGIWLPNSLEFKAAMSIAVGTFDLRYTIAYHDYRRAGVTSKVTIPKGP